MIKIKDEDVENFINIFNGMRAVGADDPITMRKFLERREDLQQILDDHEKARKWDESLLGVMLERDEITVGDYMQNIKLKERIEKEIEGLKPQIDELTNLVHPEINSVYFTLQQLLEESKK